MKNYKLLLFTTLIISGCSICYELIISAVSSYLIGDSTLQYSITIGLYMSAMGLGSFISKYIKKDLFKWFVIIELGIGVIGGISSLTLFLANLYLETYQIIMYIEIIIIAIDIFNEPTKNAVAKYPRCGKSKSGNAIEPINPPK